MGKYGIAYNGNIDLDKRQALLNDDGSVSTESSIGISDGNGTEYLIPTIIGGRRVSEPDAQKWFEKTGEHLGKTHTPTGSEGWNAWEKYANNIHLRQSEVYKSPVDTYNLRRGGDVLPTSGLGGDFAEYIVPEEEGLIDVSGAAIIPVRSTFSGLKGIQLAKGADLARKVSYAKEMVRNKNSAKQFAVGLGLGGQDLAEVINK